MRPYTLGGSSLRAARSFYYRACAFEAVHLPFLLALLGLTLHHALNDRLDLVLELSLVNLAANVFPVMHHRRTRMRIVRLLDRRGRVPVDPR